MARFDGPEVELTEYPLFDTWFSGVGISNIDTNKQLFLSSQVGTPKFTNMQQAGVIPSGGVFLISSLRTSTYFLSLASTEFTVAYGGIAAVTQPTSSPARMLMAHSILAYSTQVTLTIAQKPMIVVPWWYLPAGGGLSGQSSINGQAVVSQGLPTRDAVYDFVRPVVVGTLQAFSVTVQMSSFGKTSVAGNFTGSAQGGTLSADFDPAAYINAADGLKQGAVYAGGWISRDIN